MNPETPSSAVFVSCDIIGHGDTGGHADQVARIRSLNAVIAGVCGTRFSEDVIWASGGDGGHMAFLGPGQTPLALGLIEALFAWQSNTNTKLRLTAHAGPLSVIEGADGRRELVGDGINVCGSLLRFGEPDCVIVSAAFRDHLSSEGSGANVILGPQRSVYLKHSRPILIMTLSVPGAFTSVSAITTRSDRSALQAAMKSGEFWAAFYHAKRLLQVDSNDRDAVDALKSITPSSLVIPVRGSNRMEAHPLLAQMNRQSMHDLLHAAQLVEREDGELICEAGDSGDAMFIILRGKVGVVGIDATAGSSPVPLDVSFSHGQIVGELALALNRNRTATLQAIGPTAFLSIGYGALQAMLDAKESNQRLQRTFNEFLLDRSLRFLCTNCSYLGAGENAPLAGLADPWEVIAEDSEQLRLDWRDAQAHLGADERFALPGIYVLAGGRLVEALQSDIVRKRLDARELPVVYCDLPNTLVSNRHAFQIDPESSNNVTLVRLSDRALRSFGPSVYARLVAAVRRQLAKQFVYDVFISYSHHDEQVASQWRRAMEAAGLRVYMGRPDAMRKFKPEIELALAESLVMAPFVSERALGPAGQAGWVQREIEYRKTLFEDDHCNILPIELTSGLSAHFADGFSAVGVSGDTARDMAEVIDAIIAVRDGVRPPPYAERRRNLPRI